MGVKILVAKKNNQHSPLMKDGRYDSGKIYDMIENQKISLSTIEFKYGIPRNDLLEIISDYNISEKTESYYKEVQRDDIISFYYNYEYKTYLVTGKVLKKYTNSVLVRWVDGDFLPQEILNLMVVPSKAVTVISKGNG